MKKEKQKKEEEGITLVALIITIIILIILAAVTIMTIYDNNFIGVAINATEKYAQEQYREIDMLDSLNSKLDNAVDAIKSMRPMIKSCTGTVSDITTITVKALAIDDDTEELTYTLNWGTDEELKEPNTKTVKGKAGEEVIFDPLTGLGNYELYYWRVDVSDEKGTTKGNIQKTRTWCRTTECTESFSKELTCTKCNGLGYISTICDGHINAKDSASLRFEVYSGTSICCFCLQSCERNMLSSNIDKQYVEPCTKCGYHGNFYPKLPPSATGSSRVFHPECLRKWMREESVCGRTIKTTCPKTETVPTECSHGCSEKHFYCEHLGNTKEASHGEL